MSKEADDRDLVEKWIPQVRKGVIELGILNSLIAGESYGYELVQRVAAIPGLVISVGTLYPVLSRLKKQGLVLTRIQESQEGPARKYYRLTERGYQAVGEMNAYWDVLKSGVEQLKSGGRHELDE